MGRGVVEIDGRLPRSRDRTSQRQPSAIGKAWRSGESLPLHLLELGQGPSWKEIRECVPISGRGDGERHHSFYGVVVPDRLLIVTSCPLDSS